MKSTTFDKMAAVIERWLPTLVPMVDQSRLFLLDYAPQDVLPKNYSAEEVRAVEAGFFLPYPVTAVEDRTGVVILADAVHGQRGSQCRRVFVEAYPVTMESFRSSRDYSQTAEAEMEMAVRRISGVIPPGEVAVAIGVGVVNRFWSPDGSHVQVDGTFHQGILASKSVKLDALPPETMSRESLSNVLSAVQEVMFLNTPNRFVVESRPVKDRVRSAAAQRTRIERTDTRPLYTLLTPNRARDQMGLPEPTAAVGGARRPHERRAHIRHLTSERFTTARGKDIFIPACWVGPSESVKGNRRYRVLLDK